MSNTFSFFLGSPIAFATIRPNVRDPGMIHRIFQVPFALKFGVPHGALTTIALALLPMQGDTLSVPPELSRHELDTCYEDSGC